MSVILKYTNFIFSKKIQKNNPTANKAGCAKHLPKICRYLGNEKRRKIISCEENRRHPLSNSIPVDGLQRSCGAGTGRRRPYRRG